MHKANRVIVWGSLLTMLLAAACLAFPFLAMPPKDAAGQAGEVVTAISLMAAYLILVIGILAVGVNTYNNLVLRRADTTLETPGNRRCFHAGVAFCIAGLAFIFFPVL